MRILGLRYTQAEGTQGTTWLALPPECERATEESCLQHRRAQVMGIASSAQRTEAQLLGSQADARTHEGKRKPGWHLPFALLGQDTFLQYCQRCKAS